jgi:GNAT superfamily N-acetyltransferase
VTSAGFRRNLRAKLRHGGVLRLLVDGLNRLGVKIVPYYLMSEDCDATIAAPEGLALEVVHLQGDDMQQVSELPMRTRSREELIALLGEGKRCLALRDRGRIAAFCWYDLDECSFQGFRFDLAEDEAYLFDAYTTPEYRGAGLAPYLRSELYRALAASGRRRLYSITVYFNQSAFRFKEKLGARVVHVGLHFRLFGRLRFSRVLRQHHALQPGGAAGHST